MFSKKPGDQPRGNVQPMTSKARSGASGNATFSVIGNDVSIVGNVTASADLHVDGRIEGDIVCTSLVQGESSEVAGAVEAETARLAGRVDGSIRVKELVVLKTARISGDVHYDALTIEHGAQVEGRFAHLSEGAGMVKTGAKPGTRAGAAGAQPATPALVKGEEPAMSLAN